MCKSSLSSSVSIVRPFTSNEKKKIYLYYSLKKILAISKLRISYFQISKKKIPQTPSRQQPKRTICEPNTTNRSNHPIQTNSSEPQDTTITFSTLRRLRNRKTDPPRFFESGFRIRPALGARFKSGSQISERPSKIIRT